MTEDRLTFRDVERLADGRSSEVRAETAAKIASAYSRMTFSKAEIAVAQDIFRVMVKDAEMRVREALSINLKSTPLLPRDIAMTLARDVDCVSVPLLRATEVLTTEDLIEIVQSQNPVKQEAIAARQTIHADVADALVENGDQSVVKRLVSNPGAHLTEPCIHRVVDRFGDDEAIQTPLVNRPVLPVTVAERLVTKVANHLRGELLSRHKISPDLAADLILQSRERATVGLAMGASDDEVEALVGQLAINDRLTPSLVLRAICMGNLKFFEHALARMAGVPVANARLLVHDQSGSGLDTLCRRADFPATILPAVKAAVLVIEETEFDSRPGEADRYSRKVIERVLTQYESLDVEFESDDLDYLLAKLGQISSAGQQVH